MSAPYTLINGLEYHSATKIGLINDILTYGTPHPASILLLERCNLVDKDDCLHFREEKLIDLTKSELYEIIRTHMIDIRKNFDDAYKDAINNACLKKEYV